MSNEAKPRSGLWMRTDRLRRVVHLYPSLFLGPWMLVYALGALFLNHNPWSRETFGLAPSEWELLREEAYSERQLP